MRRTNIAILLDFLKDQPATKASPHRIANGLGWEIEKVQKVCLAAMEQLGTVLHTGPGGVIKYHGSERVKSNGLYQDISRIIRDYWGSRELGLREISSFETSRSGLRGHGVWTHPDIVLLAHPARRKSQNEKRRTHAIEVETRDGFDLRSVYQAHAQGQGADYSWVFGSKSPRVVPKDWDRVMETAAELGIGLVTFVRAGTYGTWTHHLDAEHRIPSPMARENFLSRTLGNELRKELDV